MINFLNNMREARINDFDVLGMRLNNKDIWKEYNYIEYTVNKDNEILTIKDYYEKESNIYYFALPKIDNINYIERNDCFISILLNDNIITSDINTKLKDIKRVRIFYPSSITKISFDGCLKISSIDYIKNIEIISRMFCNCSSLTSLDLSGFDTSNVTDMSYMFTNCSSLTSLDLSNFDTSNVTDMSYMFTNCSSLINWNFKYNKINDSRINYIKFNLTENETDFSGLFPWNFIEGCNLVYSIDSTINNEDTIIAQDENSKYLYLPNKNYIKKYGITLNNDNFILNENEIENLKVSEINTIFVYIEENNYFNFSDSRIKSIYRFNYDLKKSIGPNYLFYNCESLIYADLSGVDTSNLTTMSSMFSGCSSLTSLDLSTWDTSNVTSMSHMFSGCSSLTSLDLSNFNTSNVNNMSYMFAKCRSLKSLNGLSNFITSSVTDMSSMFSGCGLTSLDLSNFDTSSVTDMSSMFYSADFIVSPLKSINLSSFNTSKVTNMKTMFYYCNRLTSLDLSNFDTSSVTDMGSMFTNCSSLKSLDLSNFNTSIVSSGYYMFNNVSSSINWNYNGNNYKNWTLTESETNFSGTFPWNQ